MTSGEGTLATEAVRAELADIDLQSTEDMVKTMAADAHKAIDAVVGSAPAISTTVDRVADCLEAGGRAIYVGAGSAGRLAVLDASELGPTFDLPPGVVEAVMAGGDRALRRAAEGAEDDLDGGASAMRDLNVGPRDIVLGISASGRTPFVVGALQHARAAGAATVAISCNPNSRIASVADHVIETVVGGEVLAGSSRLNAGTAQKIVLNIISTAAMVKLGKTYGNLMVDLRPTNSKLRDRAIRIVGAVADVDAEKAAEALVCAGWNTKLACLLAWSGRDAATGAEALEAARGRLRQAMSQLGFRS